MSGDERLDRAIRDAIGDLVAAAPRRDGVPVGDDEAPVTGATKRRLVAVAVALTAAAGLVGLIAVTARPMSTPAPPRRHRRRHRRLRCRPRRRPRR